MAPGLLKEVKIEPYKTPSGDDIKIKETVKDSGALATNNLMFREHIGKSNNRMSSYNGIFNEKKLE